MKLYIAYFYVFSMLIGYGQINTKNDSLQIRQLKRDTYRMLRKGDTPLFKKLNSELYNLSSKLGDTSSLAEYYWNNAVFFKNKEVMDSAYYNYDKAQEYYQVVKDTSLSARMLLNMAFVRGRLNDYTGGEVLLFKAIAQYESLNKVKSLYTCYNRLGLFYTELGEDDKAIFYFNKALEYLNSVEDKETLLESTFSNIGLMYHKSGNHLKAIEYYDKALENDSLEIINNRLYAVLLDNHAYSRLLSGDSTNVKRELMKSLSIRESLNNKSAIAINKIHIANYYAKSGDTLLAIQYVKEASILAKTTKTTRDYLASLKLLSILDKSNANKYLTDYVRLSDSLQIEERRVRNKFTRISYETDKYIEETDRLSQKNLWMTAIGIVLLIMFSLLYFLLRQRSWNRKLFFETKEQAYKEDIYKLMLKQQASLEKGRLDERKRISEELHDGVLSKLFGTRMGMGFLNLKGDEASLRQHKMLINELQDAEKEIRVISHELKNDSLSNQLEFISLIEELVEKQSLAGKYMCNISVSDNIYWSEVDEEVKIHLYRIIQEALYNISKHSKAKNVRINFKMKDKLFILTLEDDGVGFDKQKNKKGIGLLNMESRTEKFNGEFSVESEIGKGTKLAVSVNM